jgi:hypothetical protein
MLNSHPDVTAYSELFLRNPPGRRPKWGGSVDIDLWAPYSGASGRVTLVDPAPYLDTEVYHRAGRLTPAVGFKVMYGQLRWCPRLLLYLKTHNIKVIHLVRENHLDVVLSRRLVQERKRAHQWTKEAAAPSVSLDPVEVLRVLRRLRRQVQLMRRLFRILGFDIHEVTYERLTQSEDELRSLLGAISVAEPGASLTSRLQKINRQPKEQVIENFEEIAAAFEGTGFEEMLIR